MQASPTGHSPGRFARWNGLPNLWRFAILHAIVCLFFLSPALLQRGYYAPADIIRIMEPFRNGFGPHNTLLSDNTVQTLPWLKLVRESVRAGNLPLWNPYSGAGVPLLANPQAVALSPLTVLFYVFNFQVALFLNAFLKLFFLGLFTYCYLRELKLQPIVAGAGAIGFTFVGFNVVWMAWHLSGVAIVLPAGLFLIERYFNTGDNAGDNTGREYSSGAIKRYPLWLSLVVAFGLVAGHPETFFHCVAVLVVYVVFKFFTARRTNSSHANLQSKRQNLHKALALAGAMILGAALTAALILPFGEYLLSSYKLAMRTNWVNESYLPAHYFILNLLPDFHGNPALGRMRFPNSYNDATMGYIGITLLFLAGCAAATQFRDKLVQFYVLLAVFCIAVVYHFRPVFDLLTALPVWKQTHNSRLGLILAFSVMVLGCHTLQALMRAPLPSRAVRGVRGVRGVAFGGGVLVLLLFWLNYLPNIFPLERWQIAVVVLFGLNVLALAAAFWRSNARRSCHLLVGLIVLETAAHGVIYNTVTAPENFYPSNALADFLSVRFARDGDKAIFIGNIMPPNLGSWYGFAQVSEYDSIGVRPYYDYKKTIGRFEGNDEVFGTDLNFQALKFGGVRYIVANQKEATLLKKRNSQLRSAFELPLVFERDRCLVLEQPVLPRAFLLTAASLSQAQEQLKLLRSNINAVPIVPVKSHILESSGTSRTAYSANGPSYLVLNENWMPGWRAAVDGAPVEVEDAKTMRLLPVPAGRHEVRVFYRPDSLRYGAMISLAALLLWSAMLLLTRSGVRRESKKPVSELK